MTAWSPTRSRSANAFKRDTRVRVLGVPLVMGVLVIAGACQASVPILHGDMNTVGCILDTDREATLVADSAWDRSRRKGTPLARRIPGRAGPFGIEVVDERGSVVARSGDTIKVCRSGAMNDDFVAIR